MSASNSIIQRVMQVSAETLTLSAKKIRLSIPPRPSLVLLFDSPFQVPAVRSHLLPIGIEVPPERHGVADLMRHNGVLEHVIAIRSGHCNHGQHIWDLILKLLTSASPSNTALMFSLSFSRRQPERNICLVFSHTKPPDRNPLRNKRVAL